MSVSLDFFNENIKKIKSISPVVTTNYIHKYTSSNINFSSHFFEKNVHKAWDLLSLARVLPVYLIEKYKNRFTSVNRYRFHLKFNVTLTEDYAKHIIEEDSIFFRSLIEHPCITIDYVEKFIQNHQTEFTVHDLFLSPNLSLDIVKKQNMNIFYIRSLVTKPGIKLSDFEELEKLYGSSIYEYLSYNPNLTFEYISNNLDKSWSWVALSQHKCITMEHIENTLNNKKYKWLWSRFSYNPNLTTDFVLKYKKKFVNKDISICKDLSIDFIKNNPYMFKFNWSVVSKHHNILIDDIVNNPNIPWVWTCVLQNPNLFSYSYHYYKYNKNYLMYSHLHICDNYNQKCIRDYESKIELVIDLLCDDLLRIVLGFI
jgi:hypothetical protein